MENKSINLISTAPQSVCDYSCSVEEKFMYQTPMLCSAMLCSCTSCLSSGPQQAASSRLIQLGKDGLACKALDSTYGLSATGNAAV